MSRRQIVNPYLPSWEYTPDCEPHVFGDRVYVYGSHDAAGGESYCVGDYVCWSAPADDLAHWSFEGVIYTRFDDPNNAGHATYAAPDVAQGPDGRYYLYYFYGFTAIGVAVSDEPAGHFRYLGRVHLADGTLIAPGAGHGAPFDPAVYVEDGRVWLYYGFGARPTDAARFGAPDEMLAGSYVAELEHDMCTVKGTPKPFVPGLRDASGTSFEEHPFLEASSFRKIFGRYYFIYSSAQGHELCWAMTEAPDVPPTYGGVIVSNGDVGLPGHEREENAVNYIANNHGSLIEIGGKPYVFYHRHTHGTQFSRQDCAEEVSIGEDGSIQQAEITSQGLNGAPLDPAKEIPAYAACHLRSAEGILHFSSRTPWTERHPKFVQEELSGVPTAARLFIANLRDGAEAGFKYLAFTGKERMLEAELRGAAEGTLAAHLDSPTGPVLARLSVAAEDAWHKVAAPMEAPALGTHALYFVYEGTGALDFMAFAASRTAGM